MAVMHSVIITNVSGSEQTVEDIGIIIADSTSQITLSEMYTFPELAGSDDLRTLVGDSDFELNDGVDDLSAADGVKYLTLHTTYDLESDYYSATELSTSGQSYVHWGNITNAPSFGLCETWTLPVEYRVTAIAATAPGGPSIEDVYIDTDDNHYYKYDGSWQDEGIASINDRVINLNDLQEDIYTFSGSVWNASDSTSTDNAGIVVEDDGDGKSAIYVYNGDNDTWEKVADFDLPGHLDGGANKHDADEIDVEGTYSNISGTPTDLESTISTIDGKLGTYDGHLDGGANKHDADEIDDENTYVNIAGSPTDVDATLTAIDTALGVAGNHNDLDEAYDEGGAGVGRTITADSGPVKIDRGASTDASFEIVPKGSLPSTNLADGQIDNKGAILCVYDNTRTKWLSISRPIFVFGRRRTTYDQYLNFFVGSLPSNNSGLRIPRNATLVSLTAQLDASGTCTFEIEKNDTGTSIATLDISATTFAVQTNTNVDVSAGDFLQCHMDATPSVEDPIILIELAWRP